MEIGISFDTKKTRLSFFTEYPYKKNSNFSPVEVLEAQNIIAINRDKIFVAEKAMHAFLTEKKVKLYSLEKFQDIKSVSFLNKTIYVDDFLYLIFNHLIKQVSNKNTNRGIDSWCVVIPHNNYFYWRKIIENSLSKIGITKLRFISPSGSYYSSPESKVNRLSNDSLLNKSKIIENILENNIKKYNKLSWYKKITYIKPSPSKINKDFDNNYFTLAILFQNSIDLFFTDYEDDVIQTIKTKSLEIFTREKFEKKILTYLKSIISQLEENFVLDNTITKQRLLTIVDNLLSFRENSTSYTINLPLLLCKDKKYRDLNINIDLNEIFKLFSKECSELISIFTSFSEQTVFNGIRRKNSKSKYVIFLGDYLIGRMIEKHALNLKAPWQLIDEEPSILTKGALQYSQVLVGKRNIVALEVLPYSLYFKSRENKFVKILKKNSTYPTFSEKYTFEATAKSERLKIELYIKNQNSYQVIKNWTVDVKERKKFQASIEIDSDLEITLKLDS